MSSHTPAPWEVENNNNREWSPTLVVAKSDFGKLVADCWMTTLIPRETAKANARLIAAAPDLLSALQRVQNALACFRDGQHYIEEGRAMSFEEIKCLVVDPAIDKALGD